MSKIKNLPTDFNITKCSDIHELFPYISMENVNGENNIEISSSVVEWEYSISTDLLYDTAKVKIAWSLYYDTIESAITGSTIPIIPKDLKNEFSIRYYSTSAGYGPYHRESLDWIAQIYTTILSS